MFEAKVLSSSDPDTLFWHSFWHTIWNNIWHIYFGILSDILFDICFDILSGIYFDILLASILTYFWHLFWHSFWRFIWHFLWRLAEIWISRLELAVEVLKCPLRSGARGWGLAMPTEIWSSRLRSGSAHWDLESRLRRKRRRTLINLESRDLRWQVGKTWRFQDFFGAAFPLRQHFLQESIRFSDVVSGGSRYQLAGWQGGNIGGHQKYEICTMNISIKYTFPNHEEQLAIRKMSFP